MLSWHRKRKECLIWKQFLIQSTVILPLQSKLTRSSLTWMSTSGSSPSHCKGTTGLPGQHRGNLWETSQCFGGSSAIRQDLGRCSWMTVVSGGSSTSEQLQSISPDLLWRKEVQSTESKKYHQTVAAFVESVHSHEMRRQDRWALKMHRLYLYFNPHISK